MEECECLVVCMCSFWQDVCVLSWWFWMDRVLKSVLSASSWAWCAACCRWAPANARRRRRSRGRPSSRSWSCPAGWLWGRAPAPTAPPQWAGPHARLLLPETLTVTLCDPPLWDEDLLKHQSAEITSVWDLWLTAAQLLLFDSVSVEMSPQKAAMFSCSHQKPPMGANASVWISLHPAGTSSSLWVSRCWLGHTSSPAGGAPQGTLKLPFISEHRPPSHPPLAWPGRPKRTFSFLKS